MKFSSKIFGCVAAFAALAALAVLYHFGAIGGEGGAVALAGVGKLTLAAVVQSSYSERISGAVAGMIGNETDCKVDTKNCETAAGIGFGLAVSRGTADRGAVLGSSAANKFLGISVRDVTLVNSTVDKYAQNQNMAVLSEGDIWVTVGTNVLAGQDVTFVDTTGVLGTAGADGTHFTIAGAVWQTSALSGGLALLRLTGDLPGA